MIKQMTFSSSDFTLSKWHRLVENLDMAEKGAALERKESSKTKETTRKRG